MAKPSLTQASSITTEVVLQLGRYHGSNELRSVQAKLTGTAREIQKLTSGNTLLGRIGENLSLEQRQLLLDAAQLINSVNIHIEHAKEKKVRDEKAAKTRQKARDAQAKRLVAEAYPFPYESLDQLLDILKTALTFNRAGCFLDCYSPQEYNLNLRRDISPETIRKLIGWKSPKDFWKSRAISLRHEFLQEIEREISYDDGSSVQDRLAALKQKVADRLSRAPVSSAEEETLRLWSDAFASVDKPEVH